MVTDRVIRGQPPSLLVCERDEETAEKLRRELSKNSLVDSAEVRGSLEEARNVLASGGVDIFFLGFPSFGVTESCAFVFSVRQEFPTVVFALYVDERNFRQRAASLAGDHRRLLHYYRLDWTLDGLEFAKEVREVLVKCLMDLGINTRE